MNGRTIETDSLFKCIFKFGRCNGNRFQGAKNVGKPQANKTNIAFFHRAQDELLLLAHIFTIWGHGHIVPKSRYAHVTKLEFAPLTCHRQAPVFTKSTLGDLGARWVLAALVFGPIDHADHANH